jgi:hypothetical protein
MRGKVYPASAAGCQAACLTGGYYFYFLLRLN